MHSVFMLTDLEGVAGVVAFEEQTYPTGKYYDDAKRLLTAEVNAAVDGLMAAGVEEVIVCDGHGPGAICFEDLHPQAKLLHGRPITTSQMLAAVSRCDAGVIVGQHAMAGVQDSNLSHTFNSRAIAWKKINGELFGEIAAFAIYAGTFGVPVIALTGEHAACREIDALIPNVKTVNVKEALGRTCAISISAMESRRLIREGMEAAVRQHQQTPVAPIKREGPFVVQTCYYTTELADRQASMPGYERIDPLTVQFVTDDAREAAYR